MARKVSGRTYRGDLVRELVEVVALAVGAVPEGARLTFEYGQSDWYEDGQLWWNDELVVRSAGVPASREGWLGKVAARVGPELGPDWSGHLGKAGQNVVLTYRRVNWWDLEEKQES